MLEIRIGVNPEMMYNIGVESYGKRGVLLLNAVTQHNLLLWAKRPLSGGLTSRRTIRHRRQLDKGRFVMIPRNEMEVVVLFSQQAQAAGFEIVSVQMGFPDAVVKHGDTEYKVEFEFKSSNFWAHRHNPTGCDLIICWTDDDEYPVLPIIALSNPDWPQTPITPPPYQERLVGYWRARALAAESEVKEVKASADVRIAELQKGIRDFAAFIVEAQEKAMRKTALETIESEDSSAKWAGEDLPDWLKELEGTE